MNAPKLMGIINMTPDSFSGKGGFTDPDDALAYALQLVREGVDILDIGGASSKPGALRVPEEVEVQRVVPLIKALRREVTIPISIDTVKPGVAREALKAGASIINDVFGFREREMVRVAKEFDCFVCLMHMRGNPRTMSGLHDYPENIISYLMKWFRKRVDFLLSHGIKRERIIIDPGIACGKSIAQNFEIMHKLQELKELGYPLLLGISRKPFLGRAIEDEETDRKALTLAMNTLMMLSGVDILRVHDVKEHREIAAFFAQLREMGGVTPTVQWNNS